MDRNDYIFDLQHIRKTTTQMNNPAFIASVLIFCHFVGDWLLQDRYVAENKSKKISILLYHLLTVHLVLVAGMVGMGFDATPSLLICLAINAAIHGVLDWTIWKIYAKFWHDPETPIHKQKAFYNTIAVDQCIHLACLMVLFL